MLDVDSKDLSSGMSCPPRAFVEPDCLANIQSSLEPGGMFVLNLGTLNSTNVVTVPLYYFFSI
jgi:hypothetical protein